MHRRSQKLFEFMHISFCTFAVSVIAKIDGVTHIREIKLFIGM